MKVILVAADGCRKSMQFSEPPTVIKTVCSFPQYATHWTSSIPAEPLILARSYQFYAFNKKGTRIYREVRSA